MNCYRFILCFTLSVTFLAVAAQDRPSRKPLLSALAGTITDRAGQPLRNVSIILHDARRGTISDSAGHYQAVAVPAGRYLIEISATGYQTIVQTVAISGTTEQNFVLQPSVIEQENVTVTGVSTAMSTRRSPQPVTVWKREQLVAVPATNIINALTRIPGVSAVTTGPAISKPFIRGLGYNRVVTINDGVRQEGQQWGDEHGIEIDDYSAQRVEVLKGPASLIYGSDALAGVINIQSLVPVAEGTIKANILGEYQTNSRLRGGYGNVAGTKRGLSWGVYGSYKGSEDYRNKYDGYVYNSKFYNKNWGGMLGYSGTWGHSYLTVSRFNQHIGMVEGDRDSATGRFLKAGPGGVEAIAGAADFRTMEMQVPYQHIRHFKLTTDNNFRIGRSRLDLVVGYQRNQRQEFGDADAPETPETYFDLQTATYAARFHLPYIGNWKTGFGVTGMVQRNRNRAAEAIIPDYSLQDIGAYVFTQYSRGKWSASGGLRVDNRHVEGRQLLEGSDVKFAAFTRDFANVSGSAGISYLAGNNLTLKLNLARGFRAPTLAELASNGAHEGTSRYEVGNNRLQSETSLQGDAGLEWNSTHVTLGISGFYNHISNFLFYERVLNGAGGDSIRIDPDGDELSVFNFNQQTANLYGVEAHLDIHPHPLDWLHFENAFSYTRARFTEAIDGSRNVPLIPAARLLSTLRGNFLPKGKHLRNLYAGFESDYTGRQSSAFTGFDTETPTAGYLLLNTYIGTDVMSRGKLLFSIHLSAMNLADVAYQNHLSRLKYTWLNNASGRAGVFNIGRNFGLRLNVPLTFSW